MIFKDITGKFRRFIAGRLAAARDSVPVGEIPASCLHRYPPEDAGPEHTGPSRGLVVLFSGDGGWAKLTTHPSRHLQQHGFAVIGIDCMHYFWKEKTPQTAAEELENLVEKFTAE